MSTTIDFIEAITEAYDPRQAWNDIHEKTPVTTGGWSKTMKSRSYNKTAIARKPTLKTLSSPCERKLIHGLYGILDYRASNYNTSQTWQNGLEFNNEIDRILKNNDQFIVGNDQLEGAKPWDRFGTVTAWAPRGSVFKNVDGNVIKMFNGAWDFLNTLEGEIIELKGVGAGHELPDEPLEESLRQLALYITLTNNVHGGKLIYLPGDLSTVDAHDASTYRSYSLDRDEAYAITTDIHSLLAKATVKLNWAGNDTYPYGSPTWFYRLVKNIPLCDEPRCCTPFTEFHEAYAVNPDWTFTPRTTILESVAA